MIFAIRVGYFNYKAWGATLIDIGGRIISPDYFLFYILLYDSAGVFAEEQHC